MKSDWNYIIAMNYKYLTLYEILNYLTMKSEKIINMSIVSDRKISE